MEAEASTLASLTECCREYGAKPMEVPSSSAAALEEDDYEPNFGGSLPWPSNTGRRTAAHTHCRRHAAHADAPRFPPPPPPPSPLCFARCKFGSKCHFAHGVDEMRQRRRSGSHTRDDDDEYFRQDD